MVVSATGILEPFGKMVTSIVFGPIVILVYAAKYNVVAPESEFVLGALYVNILEMSVKNRCCHMGAWQMLTMLV